jgi:hypothetical protein
MKKLISLAIIAGISLLIAGVDRSASANTQAQLLTGILNKMEKAHQDLKSLKEGPSGFEEPQGRNGS